MLAARITRQTLPTGLIDVKGAPGEPKTGMRIEIAGSFNIYKRQQPAGLERIKLCPNIIMRIKLLSRSDVTAFFSGCVARKYEVFGFTQVCHSCFFLLPLNRLARLLAVQSSKTASGLIYYALGWARRVQKFVSKQNFGIDMHTYWCIRISELYC